MRERWGKEAISYMMTVNEEKLSELQKESLAFGIQALTNTLRTLSGDLDEYCLAEMSLSDFIERVEDGIYELSNHRKGLRALAALLEHGEHQRELGMSIPGPSV